MFYQTSTYNNSAFHTSGCLKGLYLGNVLSVISDKPIPHVSTGTTVDYFLADIRQASDYSPFGVQLSGRTLTASSVSKKYRMGYQGSEMDNEVKGSGNSYTTEFRQLDPRLGRWLTIDPKMSAWESPYVSMGNNPIIYNDANGDTIKVTTSDGKYLFTLDDKKSTVKVCTAKEVYDMQLQWFEPLADNYCELIKKADNLTHMSELKHFSWEDIIHFVDEDLWMSSYVQGGKGDWKVSKKGADGYILVTVGGEPYWADAIGQIPFAVDCFTDYLEEKQDQAKAIACTTWKGEEYSTGELFGGTPDFKNTYDSYMVLRGALWACYNHALANDEAIRMYPTDYSKLSTPITQTYKNKYLNNLIPADNPSESKKKSKTTTK